MADIINGGESQQMVISDRLVSLPAPGKLNLMLRIVGQRPDGYHELQTIFQFIDHCDWLTFKLREDGVIRLENSLDGVPDESNLIVRAARLIKQFCPQKQLGVDISLIKRLPMGGGLGGGSSDAATTLAGLARLWGCGLDRSELMKVGLSLGADVPIFLFARNAWGEGVGERLIPMHLPDQWFVIAVPGCHVTTAEIFRDKDLTRDSPRITMENYVSHLGDNDCQSLVFDRYPEVARAGKLLSEMAGRAALTGTGACVYSPVNTKEDGERIVLALSDQSYSAFIAKGVSESPLARVL